MEVGTTTRGLGVAVPRDPDLDDLDLRGLAAEAAACVQAEIAAGCRLLRVAACWADWYPADGMVHQRTPLAVAGQRSMQFGGDGTPAIAEGAPARLGLECRLGPRQAAGLIADAVDLRHRLPRVWHRVCAAQIPAWQARRVAFRTRALTRVQAGVVDRALARQLGKLTRRRLDLLIDAELLRVDPDRAAKAAAAARARQVWTGESNEYGLKDFHARMDAADAIWLDAMVDRLADILQSHPDRVPAGVPDRDARTKQEWRAVALGVLARPLVAARILAEDAQPDLFDDLPDLADTDLTDTDLTDDYPVDHDGPGDPDDHRGDRADRAGDQPCDRRDDHRGDDRGDDLDDDRGDDHGHDRDDARGDGLGGDPSGGQTIDAASGEDQPRTAADADGRPRPEGPEPVEGPETAPDPARAPSLPAPTPVVLTPAQREHLLAELARRIRPDRLAPRTVLHIHLNAEALLHPDGLHPDGPDEHVVRTEDLGPQLAGTVKRWLTGTRLRLQPVLDPTNLPAVDAYETPDWMADGLFARSPASVFPFTTALGRRLQKDHTIPFQPPPAGPPGQTGGHNLGPLAVSEHRAKTFGAVRVAQPQPGTFLWRSSFGRVMITNPTGTFDLGTGPFPDAIWHAVRHHGFRGTGRRSSSPRT